MHTDNQESLAKKGGIYLFFGDQFETRGDKMRWNRKIE